MRNRFWLGLQALIWGLIALVSTLLLVSFFNGNNPLNGLSFVTSLNPISDQRMTVTLYDKVLTDDIDELSISWNTGGVTILPSTDGKLHVIERSSAQLAQSKWAKFDQNGKSLSLVSRNNGIFFLFWNTPVTTLEVRLPEDAYQKLVLKMTSGSYSVSHIDFATFKASLTSGELIVTDSAMADLSLDMQSGKGVFTGASTHDLDVYSTSGSFNYTGSVSGSLNAELTSGEQVYRLSSSAPTALSLQMTSGSARLSLPANDGFRLELDKTSGSFEADFAHTQSDDTYTYGNGAATYKAEMTSGFLSISVE